MRAERYDVLILGGGNAGMGVTVATRAAGISVTMVEPGNDLSKPGLHAQD
jgi:glycerol-3-phosphate dehydrogenase